jgi:hypothetical protein
MDARFIKRAAERLESAREALRVMEGSPSWSRFRMAWWDFVLAANAIFSTLQQGAKANGKSSAWYGRVKHMRDNDELLSYLHHARNSEEHGLGSARTFAQLIPADKRSKVKMNPETGDIHVTVPSRKGMIGKLIGPGTGLIPVTDTRNPQHKTFYPPKMHLEKPIADQTPIGVARLALSYLEALLVEAREYVVE